MKFGIIKERKNPPDRRVVFSPKKLRELQEKFPTAKIEVESSNIRVFTDEEYTKENIQVSKDMTVCDVLLGVKEVPVDALIPNKKYFFFSHTIKKQPYNRNLLKAILDKNIELYDHETITKENGMRLIGFGRYAGIVGAYNGFRAIGLTTKSFQLPKAETLDSKKELIKELQKITLSNKFKILLTGNGKVAYGAKEMLDAMNIKQVSVHEYLSNTFNEVVYCMIDVLDYNKRKDGQKIDNLDFYNHPETYESNFMRFAEVTDFFIAGHFFGDGSPYLFTREDAKKQNFKIKYVADISCDIDGPVASTIRPSTITEPIYGYHPKKEKEVNYTDKDAIVVMAVDNLPCELPKDASLDFGRHMLDHILPQFFNDDEGGILENASLCKDGGLSTKYAYMSDFVAGKV